MLLRGNLRRPGQEAAVFEEVAAAVARLCGEMAAAAGVWQAAGSFWVVGVGCLRWWAPWPGCAVRGGAAAPLVLLLLLLRRRLLHPLSRRWGVGGRAAAGIGEGLALGE